MSSPSAAPRWITKTKRRSVAARARTRPGATSTLPAPKAARRRKRRREEGDDDMAIS
jgi:hypothetical protein